MKVASYLACCTLFLFLACSRSHFTVIKSVDLFDGEKVHQGVHLIIDDSLIVDITTKDKPLRRAEKVIDGTGKTILPPLLNAHVHVRDPQNLQEAQQEGIFGLLDMFSTFRRATYLRTYRDSIGFARLYSSNEGATVAGGHGTQFRVQIPTLSDDLSGDQFVENRLQEGADYIKLTQEHSMAKLSLPQIQSIVETAHRYEKKVLGHISSLSDGLHLAQQGVDGLAHMWYRKGSVAQEPDLSILKENKTFIIPTLSVIQQLTIRAKDTETDSLYLPFEKVLLETGKAHRAGVMLLAGTDAPNFGLNYHTALFEEVILLHQAGLSTVEALKACSTNIYQAFHLDEFSPLQAGSPASFLLIDGRPLDRLEDLRNAKRIWQKGQELRPT